MEHKPKKICRYKEEDVTPKGRGLCASEYDIGDPELGTDGNVYIAVKWGRGDGKAWRLATEEEAALFTLESIKGRKTRTISPERIIKIGGTRGRPPKEKVVYEGPKRNRGRPRLVKTPETPVKEKITKVTSTKVTRGKSPKRGQSESRTPSPPLVVSKPVKKFSGIVDVSLDLYIGNNDAKLKLSRSGDEPSDMEIGRYKITPIFRGEGKTEKAAINNLFKEFKEIMEQYRVFDIDYADFEY